MLNQLLANLPYNPSLIHQVSFYGKRMKAERSIRAIGFSFVLLAFLVQLFAVISPPQSSLAASSNDLVNGGFNSAAEAASDCQSNIENYGTILANYGISCARVAQAPSIYIQSTEFNNQLFSMGRLPYGIAGETPINIAGSTYFARYLWGWDTGGPSTYEALNVTSPGGQTFFLLYNCGNVTSVGFPTPVQQPPAFTLTKTMTAGYPAANSQVAPGTLLDYTIHIDNTGGSAQNVQLRDPQPAYTTYDSSTGGDTVRSFDTSSNTAIWDHPSIPASTINVYYDTVAYRVNSTAPNGAQICNNATLSGNGITTIQSNTVCVTVKVNAPPPTPAPTPPPVCQYDTSILQSNSLCVACPYNSTIIQSNSQCIPCTQSVSSQDTIACVQISKTATDLTQHIANANGTTAQAGDQIQYTLYAKNTGKGTVNAYQFQDNISDVLDYATVQDLNGGTLNAQTGELTWPDISIPAGQTATQTFQVQVMNPIPQTPPSSSDPQGFNYIMTNVYGSTININLPVPVVQATARAAQSLPNTGPGSSLLIAGAVTVAVGYFFARSRLLAKETDIVRIDMATAGDI